MLHSNSARLSPRHTTLHRQSAAVHISCRRQHMLAVHCPHMLAQSCRGACSNRKAAQRCCAAAHSLHSTAPAACTSSCTTTSTNQSGNSSTTSRTVSRLPCSRRALLRPAAAARSTAAGSADDSLQPGRSGVVQRMRRTRWQQQAPSEDSTSSNSSPSRDAGTAGRDKRGHRDNTSRTDSSEFAFKAPRFVNSSSAATDRSTAGRGTSRGRGSQQLARGRGRRSSDQDGGPGQLMPLPAGKALNKYQLNEAIKACSTPDELQQLVQQHGSQMDAINIASAINMLPKLQTPRHHQQRQQQQQQPVSSLQLLEQLWHLLRPELLLQCRGRQLSNILWASSKLQCENADLYSSCLGQYLKGAVKDTPRHLSNVVYALCTAPAAIRRQHQAAVMQQLVPAFMQQLGGANAQDISNVLYGVAGSGQELTAQQVVQLLGQFMDALATAQPQNVSNTLWAMASMGQQVEPGQLQQLLTAFVGMLWQANPQNVSNTLWAVATMGQQVEQNQLQQLLAAFVSMLRQAKPQEVCNTLWAVATMGQQVQPAQLQQLLDAFVGMLQRATPQNVANTLWACGKLEFAPLDLLSAPQLTSMLLAANPQSLANIAWACGQLGDRNEQLMAALLREALQWLSADSTDSRGSSSFTAQGLCNLCWSVAVLHLQQHADQVLLLVQACSQQWGSMEGEGLRQLQQVHTWLLDFQLAGGQGLAGTLTEQQLQQCKAAWDKQQDATFSKAASPFQAAVLNALQQLPISWDQPPRMEQCSVDRDGVTDGALLIDIAATTASGVLLAIEVDGPSHFRQPDGGLTGPTQYRNRALAVRGYTVISIPWFDWRKLQGDNLRQQQYLRQQLAAVGVV